ncbi:MAG: methylenetetrahydrofolate reductase [Fimbriimonadaceae bacterium]|nr:methylenetetrahydrofolate reductase [Alphaproteobacteria bacterium]
MADRYQTPVQSRLMQTLLADRFALTAEIVPPVSAGADDLYRQVDVLADHVDAINLADSAGGKVHMSGLACAALMLNRGVEPVLQMVCRDRNRLALYSDLLGAGALGVHNLLIMKGDKLDEGELPDTDVVHDMESVDLIAVASALTETGILRTGSVKFTSTGVVTAEKKVPTPPTFFIGAADVAGQSENKHWEPALRKKVHAGAQFIQTQLCYDVDTITRYAAKLRQTNFSDNLFVLIGTGPLKSARSALWMRDNLWGVDIPDTVIARLQDAKDERAEGIRICVEILMHIAQTRGLSGAHLMAPGNHEAIPEIVKLANADLQSQKMART